jgi:hypothetical protein
MFFTGPRRNFLAKKKTIIRLQNVKIMVHTSMLIRFLYCGSAERRLNGMLPAARYKPNKVITKRILSYRKRIRRAITRE